MMVKAYRKKLKLKNDGLSLFFVLLFIEIKLRFISFTFQFLRVYCSALK